MAFFVVWKMNEYGSAIFFHICKTARLRVHTPVVFFDAIHIKMQGDNGLVTPKAVQNALGVDLSDWNEVLGLWIAENEIAKD